MPKITLSLPLQQITEWRKRQACRLAAQPWCQRTPSALCPSWPTQASSSSYAPNKDYDPLIVPFCLYAVHLLNLPTAPLYLLLSGFTPSLFWTQEWGGIMKSLKYRDGFISKMSKPGPDRYNVGKMLHSNRNSVQRLQKSVWYMDLFFLIRWTKQGVDSINVCSTNISILFCFFVCMFYRKRDIFFIEANGQCSASMLFSLPLPFFGVASALYCYRTKSKKKNL